MFRVSVLARAVLFTCVTGLFTFSTTLPSNAQGYDRPFSWTGFYVGIQGGGATGLVDPGNALTNNCATTPNFCRTPDQEPTGWLAGGQVGYNWQFGSAVLLGVEADIAFGDITDEVPDSHFLRQNTKIDWFGTARVRLGLPMDRFMPYITGGLAYARTTSGESCPDPAPGPGNGWCSSDRHGTYHLEETRWTTGWTVGGGVEAAFGKGWSLKAEYLYVDLGHQTHVLDPLGVVSNPNPPRPSASDRNADWTMHVIRAGLNYRF